MSYSHYLPRDDYNSNPDRYTYRYNAIARSPVSHSTGGTGFNEQTSRLLSSKYEASRLPESYFQKEEPTYYLSKKFTRSSGNVARNETPFQTADYIHSKKFDDSNLRRSGHFYMTSSNRGYYNDNFSESDSNDDKVKIKTFSSLSNHLEILGII